LFTIFPNDLFILHLGKTLLPTHCGIVLQDYGGKKNKMHSYGPLISDVWKDIHRISHKKRRDEHPCQLPIPLVVAKHLGRNYIAIDIDSKYMKITKEKLENVQPTKINNTYVSIYLGKIITIRDKDWENLKFLNKVSSEKSKINNKIPTLF